jgi:hypothetical protein
MWIVWQGWLLFHWSAVAFITADSSSCSSYNLAKLMDFYVFSIPYMRYLIILQSHYNKHKLQNDINICFLHLLGFCFGMRTRIFVLFWLCGKKSTHTYIMQQ